MTIQDIINNIDQNKAQLGITLYRAAQLSEIEEFEKTFNVVLPDDIKAFYKFCNGFESKEDIFRIISLEEMIDYQKELNKNEFYIAEYMIYSDMWVVELNPDDNTYKIRNFFKTILTNSFTEFLNRFLIGGVFEKDGLYEWKDQIINRSPSTNL